MTRPAASSHRLANDALQVEIAAAGAELQRIVDADGRDWLWDGDPAWWAGRAPILFPIVGALRNDAYRLDDARHTLPKHGFARRSRFDLAAGDDSAATWRLVDSPATRAAYPFAFALDVRYALAGCTLRQQATVTNHGDAPMPMSFGWHPALRWPLPGTGAREDHIVRFERAETAPIRGVSPDGLLVGEHPSPVARDTLALHDRLFASDALVFDRIASRRLWFGVPGHPGVRVDFPDMPMLALWTKPGAGYLCIEPWQGHADPADFDGDFADKPGSVRLAPGEARRFTMDMTFGVDCPFDPAE